MNNLVHLHERQVKWQKNAMQSAISLREEELMKQAEKDLTFAPKLYTVVPAKVCIYIYIYIYK